MNLSPSETRVLGCLLEKQRTTPDMYPLTLNALRLACNQSTNRYPVLDYDDEVIRDALHRLERRGLTRLASGRGRAPKYRHLLAEALPMSSDEQAVVCVLMLRGAQTPGELKQRAERMHPFAELPAVHDTLARLTERGLVERLPRRPGQKEERYRQLLEDPDSVEDVRVTAREAGSFARAPVVGDAPASELPLGGDVPGSSEPSLGGGAPGASEPTGGGVAPGANEADFAAHARGTSGTSSIGDASGHPSGESLEQRVARLERAVAELREAVRS